VPRVRSHPPNGVKIQRTVPISCQYGAVRELVRLGAPDADASLHTYPTVDAAVDAVGGGVPR